MPATLNQSGNNALSTGDRFAFAGTASGVACVFATACRAGAGVPDVLRQRLLETRDVGQRLERVSAEVVAMTARLGGGPGAAN